MSGGNSENTNHNQQTPPPWVSGTFSVSISTPDDDLSIRLPPIQLPSGITSLIGGFAQQQNNQSAHGAATTPTNSSSALPHSVHNTTNLQNVSENQTQTSSSGHSPPAPPNSATSVTNSPAPHQWVRASSTPATLDSTGSSGDSFIIHMLEGHEAQQTTPTKNTNSQNSIRRRHSHSSSPNSQRPNQQGKGDTDGHTPRREQHPPARHHVLPVSAIPQQQADDTQTAVPPNSSSSESANQTSNSTQSSGDNSNTSSDSTASIQYLRQRLSEAFRRRHQIFWGIVQQTGEYPSLYVFGVIVCTLLLLSIVLLHFFAVHFGACLSLIFAFSHHSDVIAFKRYVSGGQGASWLIAAKLLLRQFMILSLLGQSPSVFPAAAFQEIPSEPITFWYTLYINILVQYLAMDILLGFKLAVAVLPPSWFGTAMRRRIYQWSEYTGALYRFAVPFVQWNAFFAAIWWTVLYGGIKILFGLALVWGWLRCTLQMFRCSHLGSQPSEAECKQAEQCTICFSEFQTPIKLKCSHIYCTECIRTWLDREVTCPICRTVVTREDNHFRNGESMMPCLF